MRATQWFFTTHVTASLRHHKPFKLRHNLSEQPVRSCHYPFPYRLASWFAVRPAPPAALHPLTFPGRQADWASKRTFFPQHLLYRYLTRSYRIRIPCGDWAGLHRWTHSCGKPHKQALVCRNSSFGPITRLILKRLCPQNQYSMMHRHRYVAEAAGLELAHLLLGPRFSKPLPLDQLGLHFQIAIANANMVDAAGFEPACTSASRSNVHMKKWQRVEGSNLRSVTVKV